MADDFVEVPDMATDALESVLKQAHSWSAPYLSLVDPNGVPAPCFPIEAMGKAQVLCSEFAVTANAPVDYVAAGILAHVAGIIVYARVVAPRTANRYDWREPLCLWIALVGPASFGKTPSLILPKLALRKLEKRLRREHAILMSEFEETLEKAKAIEKAWKGKVDAALKKDEEPPERPPEAVMPVKPILPRVTVSDSTIEELAHLLGQNPKGLLLFRDELSVWLDNMSRYTSGSDRAIWLEFFNGGEIKVDRRSLATPLIVDQAIVSIIGGIQPARLQDTLNSAADGLQARFLFVYSNEAPLRRVDHMPDGHALECAFEKLYDMNISFCDGSINPGVISLSEVSQETFFQFRKYARDLEKKHDGLIEGWIGKGPGMVLRLAGILSLLDWSLSQYSNEPGQIDEVY